MKITAKFKLPSLADIRGKIAQAGQTVPKHAKWALALVAALIGLGFAVYFGYFVLLLFIVVSGIVASYWPILLGVFVVSSVVGGAINRRQRKSIFAGASAGIFYALLFAVVSLVAFAAYAAATGFH